MSSMYSILLLKPDAFHKSISDQVLQLVDVYGLEMICRHHLTANGRLMIDAFPECSGDHLIEQLLLECQYAGEPVELALVYGEGAIKTALKLRADARRRWATGLFANVVHAADEPAEWALQLRTLAAGCSTCDTIAATVDDTYHVKKFPLSLPRKPNQEDHLKQYLQKLWDDPTSSIWQDGTEGPIVVGSPEPATHAVVLLENYDRFSIDGLTAAVLAAFPQLDLEAAVRVVLAAGHRRQFVLAVAPHYEAQQIAALLRDLGLILEIRNQQSIPAN
jgi:nucleoside diphosphate kinase